VALLGGCGGSDSSSTSLTQGDFTRSRAEANPTTLLHSGRPFREADKLVVAYGVTHCKF
jgi:hypothetical protein